MDLEPFSVSFSVLGFQNALPRGNTCFDPRTFRARPAKTLDDPRGEQQAVGETHVFVCHVPIILHSGARIEHSQPF